MTDATPDEAVTDSGGTMKRLREPPREVSPDLPVLESVRTSAYDDPVRAAGGSPYPRPGDLVTWQVS